MGGDVTSLEGQVDALHCTTSDHNFLPISQTNLMGTGCTVGNNDEVMDLVLMGESNTQRLVAFNSPAIRMNRRDTWNCALANGHTYIVLCPATCTGDTISTVCLSHLIMA
jgi:hypothetical protein